MKCWALDEFYKVNPVTGNILELDIKRYPMPRHHSFDNKNRVWNRDDAKITIIGARNETVGFQLMIEGPAIDAQNPVVIRLGGLKGNTGRKPAFICKMYREWYLSQNGHFYADGLIPVQSGSQVNLKSPDNKIPGHKVQGFYIDIFIPPETKAGDYSTTLTISTGKKNSCELSVNLEVLRFSLPSRPSFTVEYNNYGYAGPAIEDLRGDKLLEYQASKRFDQETLICQRLAHEHYGTLNIVPYKQNGGYSPAMAPALGTDYRIKNFANWDRKFGQYFNGRAFTEGYGKGEPVAVFYLPYSFTWPAPYHFFPSDDYQKLLAENTRLFERHFKEKGWGKTKFHIILNHKSRRSIFPYNGDEPTRVKDYGMLRYYGGAVKEGQKGSDKLIQFRLDIGHFDCHCIMDKCDWQPNEKRCSHSSLMEGFADLWVCSYGHTKAAAMMKLRKTGNEMWLYMGNSWINRPLSDMGQILLNAYKMNAQGYCFWCSHCWEGNPWYDVGSHLGTGFVFYPGKEMGINAPLPSLRLKASRRAVMDIEYLEALRKKKQGKKADKALQSFVRKYSARKVSLMDEEKAQNTQFVMTDKAGWDGFRNTLIEEARKL